MNNQQAKDLIHKLFMSSFDRQRYEQFLLNLLNHFEPRGKHYTGMYIPPAFREHINQYWRIGKYVDPVGEELDLLVVEVKTLAKLERARSALRNFAVNRLKQFEKEASLIAFYAKDDGGKDWRFSFVKIEHEAYWDEQGKVKLKQELTPAKRYSFLVGVHETSHTAAKQLLPVLGMDYADPRIGEIEAAFSIEKVSSEFFEQYKQLFLTLAGHLKTQPFFQHDSEEETGRSVSRFAKKLLGQIIFLYFLQKKGWLGVPKNGKWGEGSKRFMREQFTRVTQDGDHYFNDFLRYLFYEALARERKGETPDYYPRFNCKIPFLNGGLFEAEYDWENEPINLPNEIFHNDEKNRAGDKGTGILDVFDRYNFTVKEDEPLEKEVAIDPEMLGKVFENMLEVTERKSKGAFYTPREIVHYICQESLIFYLDNTLNTDVQNDDSTGSLLSGRSETNIRVPREDLDALVRKGYLFIENDQDALQTFERIQKGKQKSTGKEIKLPESVRRHAKEIDEALAAIKVCDPAIGSGAFPVGLLHEIVNARLALAPHSGNQNSLYELKRHAIRESIYGVDIDASAIDIARLRLWLSLIVDEERYDTIEPLPNLDYKIIRGDSLIEKYEGIKLFDEAFLQETNAEDPLESLRKTEQTLAKERSLTKKELFYAYRQNNVEKSTTYEAKLQQLNQKLKDINRQKKRLYKKDLTKTDGDPVGRIIDFYINEARNKALQLENLHQKFFNLTSLSEKRRLRHEIDQIEWELVEATLKEQNRQDTLDELQKYKSSGEKPWFIWQLNFSEVFKLKGGFDIVIGNPPYVQIQKFSGQRIQKEWEQQNYETFTRTGDIYCLFYEKGYRILRDGGVLAFITSNKWMRAAYGKKLREFFNRKAAIEQLIDFGDSPIFSEATTYTNILLFRKATGNSQTKAWDLSSSYKAETSLEQMLEAHGQAMPIFGADGFTLLDSHLATIKKRIEEVGMPLREWDVSINYGIKTGFNEAFIIDGKKRNELIAADPKNTEIIKPILRGRDIKRYRVDFADLWLINTHNGYGNVPPIDINDYPAIKAQLDQYWDKLEKRQDKGITPYNLRNCAYVDEFEKEKIVWLEMSPRANFAYLPEPCFVLNTSYILTGNKLKWILAILNSSVLEAYFPLISTDVRGKTRRYIKQYVELLPVAEFDEHFAKFLEPCVDSVQLAKRSGKTLQSAFFEQLIDGLVYEFYFTDEINAAGKEILPHLGELEPLTDEMNDEEKLAVIRREFDRLYDPNHPVRNHLETLDSVEVVRTIQEALKK